MKIFLALLLSFMSITGFANEAAWPNKPVRIIIAYPPGGDTDIFVRKIQKRLEEELKQPLTIEYKPGASGNIGAIELVNSRSDGYTWLVALEVIITTNPYTLPNTFNLNAVRPVTLMTTRSAYLVCRNDLNVNSLKEFLEVGKKRIFSHAHAGIGSVSYYFIEAARRQFGHEVIHVPYSGTSPMLQSVVSKQVDCALVPYAVAGGAIQGKLVTALGYSGSQRSPALPEIPTFTEFGYKGPSGSVFMTLYGHREVPEPIVNKMFSAIQTVLRDPNIVSDMKSIDYRVVLSPVAETEKILKDITNKQIEYLKQ